MNATLTRPEPLTDSETYTVAHGLRIAAERFTEHAAEFSRIADALAEGATVAMFAPGAAGATAALQLRDTFTRQAAEATALAERFEQAESVTVVPWTGEDADQ